MALQEADFDHRTFTTPDAGDERLYVRFYLDTMRDDVKSAEEGRPIYREREFIMIQAPGDLLKCIKRPIREGDKRRFPRQWAAFKVDGDQQANVGTPLAQWPMVSRSQVEELAYFKVHTVEQLAGIADNLTQKFMGIQQLKQAAKDWLGRAENSKEIVGLRNENTRMAQQITELQAAMAEHKALLEKRK